MPVFILVVFFGVVGHTFLNTSITSSISAGNLAAPDTAGHRAITHAPGADRGGEWLTRQPAGARDGRGVSASSPGMCGMDQFTYLMAFHAFARPPIASIAKALQRAGPPAYGARPAPGLALLSVPPPRVS